MPDLAEGKPRDRDPKGGGGVCLKGIGVSLAKIQGSQEQVNKQQIIQVPQKETNDSLIHLGKSTMDDCERKDNKLRTHTYTLYTSPITKSYVLNYKGFKDQMSSTTPEKPSAREVKTQLLRERSS